MVAPTRRARAAAARRVRPASTASTTTATSSCGGRSAASTSSSTASGTRCCRRALYLNRRFGVDNRATLALLLDEWNRTKLFPKAFTILPDDGMVGDLRRAVPRLRGRRDPGAAQVRHRDVGRHVAALRRLDRRAGLVAVARVDAYGAGRPRALGRRRAAKRAGAERRRGATRRLRPRPRPGAALLRVPPAGRQDAGRRAGRGRLPAHPARPTRSRSRRSAARSRPRSAATRTSSTPPGSPTTSGTRRSGTTARRALDAVASACGGFEGNAQTLRVLTRLEAKVAARRRASRPGSTSPAPCWTPPASTRGPRRADAAQVRLLRRRRATPSTGCGPARADGRRCLEAQVMDWADDVAYSVHDVEDGVHGGAGPAGRGRRRRARRSVRDRRRRSTRRCPAAELAAGARRAAGAAHAARSRPATTARTARRRRPSGPPAS